MTSTSQLIDHEIKGQVFLYGDPLDLFAVDVILKNFIQTKYYLPTDNNEFGLCMRHLGSFSKGFIILDIAANFAVEHPSQSLKIFHDYIHDFASDFNCKYGYCFVDIDSCEVVHYYDFGEGHKMNSTIVDSFEQDSWIEPEYDEDGNPEWVDPEDAAEVCQDNFTLEVFPKIVYNIKIKDKAKKMAAEKAKTMVAES